ncbi:hypothetical protein Ddc_24081 [Ditylenchus destructor]|nr:hypothetical protein Ddc_24081 [Ditylenchus destructor]
MTHADNDYTDLVIVAEDQWYSRKQEKTTMCVYNTRWEIQEELINIQNNGPTIEIVYCEEFPPEKENCHAEVLFITDNALVNKVC